ALQHRLRRRRGRVPRGRAAGAARPDVPEPPPDARVRRPRRRPHEADADDELRHDRGARHDDELRRRGGREGRLRPRRRGAPEARRQHVARLRNSCCSSCAAGPRPNVSPSTDATGITSRTEEQTNTSSAASGRASGKTPSTISRSEEHTSELQSLAYLVCRLLLEKKNYT